MAQAALRACTSKSEVLFLDRRVLVYDLVDRIEILVEDLVHGEHVYAVLLEDCAHSIVAPNLALVARVLEFARLDIFPYLLYRLRSRELGFAEQFGEGWREGHRFLVKVSCCWTARQWFKEGNLRGNPLSDSDSSCPLHYLIRYRCRLHP